ncbi:head-tail connector protein [Rouxiella badensis]|nr:head-tail connector protein [Rouxiella badensis]
MVPTLEQLRLQCRIDDEESDELLTLMAGAAVRKAENFINRKLYDETVPDTDEDGLLISDDVTLALLLLVGHWYSNREAATEIQQTAIPFGFTALLEPYRFIPL